mmetsp:Transcript_45948/g.115681  ORF Transcript_45948/g.115681 Transcript_45948/m.115681 type:complete len:249 (-) Transcript_45948:66-812(-)
MDECDLAHTHGVVARQLRAPVLLKPQCVARLHRDDQGKAALRGDAPRICRSHRHLGPLAVLGRPQLDCLHLRLQGARHVACLGLSVGGQLELQNFRDVAHERVGHGSDESEPHAALPGSLHVSCVGLVVGWRVPAGPVLEVRRPVRELGVRDLFVLRALRHARRDTLSVHVKRPAVGGGPVTGLVHFVKCSIVGSPEKMASKAVLRNHVEVCVGETNNLSRGGRGREGAGHSQADGGCKGQEGWWRHC